MIKGMSNKMRLEKRMLVILIVIVCLCLFFYGCFQAIPNALPDFGPKEWRYYLSHGYRIDEMHYGRYLLVNDSWEEYIDGTSYVGIVVDMNVVSFCYNDAYIGLQCIQEYDIEQNEAHKNVDYYLIDMDANRKNGPFTEEAYYQFCTSNKIGPIGIWIDTIPRPSGATYDY